MNIDLNKAADIIEKTSGLTPVTIKKIQSYQIIWRGQVMKFRNGKSVWSSLGAAKCALSGKVDKDRLENEACRLNGPKPWRLRWEVYQQTIDELQKAGILEFRPVS